MRYIYEVPGTKEGLKECDFLSPLLGRSSIIINLQHFGGAELDGLLSFTAD